jgi:hypothetical protein
MSASKVGVKEQEMVRMLLDGKTAPPGEAFRSEGELAGW